MTVGALCPPESHEHLNAIPVGPYMGLGAWLDPGLEWDPDSHQQQGQWLCHPQVALLVWGVRGDTEVRRHQTGPSEVTGTLVSGVRPGWVQPVMTSLPTVLWEWWVRAYSAY